MEPRFNVVPERVNRGSSPRTAVPGHETLGLFSIEWPSAAVPLRNPLRIWDRVALRVRKPTPHRKHIATTAARFGRPRVRGRRRRRGAPLARPFHSVDREWWAVLVARHAVCAGAGLCVVWTTPRNCRVAVGVGGWVSAEMLVSEDVSDSDVIDLTAAALSPPPSGTRSGTAASVPRSPTRSTPSMPRTAPPTPSRSRRKHSRLNKDWVAACATTPRDGPAFVYVIHSERHDRVYVGMTTDGDEDAIAAAHDRGTRGSTRGKGPWRVKLLVGPFPTRTAAMRFERVVKHRGRAAGLGPKIRAAYAGLDAAAGRGPEVADIDITNFA